MASYRSSRRKRKGAIMLLALLTYSLISLIITRVVFDRVFVRYDFAPPAPVAEAYGFERVWFESGDNTLCGYFMEDSADSRGLIVFSPGFRSSALRYREQITAIAELGWTVFSYDCTGSYGSEGDSTVGFPQAIADLDSALSYIESLSRFDDSDIFVVGHSWGGYAACCSGSEIVKGVVSISGVNSAMEAIMAPAVRYAGLLAYIGYPFVYTYQICLFGQKAISMRADESIDSRDIPFLIIQAENDAIAPVDSGSIYSHREDVKNTNVYYVLSDGNGEDGHTTLLFDAENRGANAELVSLIDSFCRQAQAGEFLPSLGIAENAA